MEAKSETKRSYDNLVTIHTLTDISSSRAEFFGRKSQFSYIS